MPKEETFVEKMERLSSLMSDDRLSQIQNQDEIMKSLESMLENIGIKKDELGEIRKSTQKTSAVASGELQKVREVQASILEDVEKHRIEIEEIMKTKDEVVALATDMKELISVLNKSKIEMDKTAAQITADHNQIVKDQLVLNDEMKKIHQESLTILKGLNNKMITLSKDGELMYLRDGKYEPMDIANATERQVTQKLVSNERKVVLDEGVITKDGSLIVFVNGSLVEYKLLNKRTLQLKSGAGEVATVFYSPSVSFVKVDEKGNQIHTDKITKVDVGLSMVENIPQDERELGSKQIAKVKELIKKGK